MAFLAFTVTRRRGECSWKLVMESEIIDVLQCLGQSCCPIQNANSTSVEKHCRENFLEGAAKESTTICNGQKRDSPSLGDIATIYHHDGLGP